MRYTIFTVVALVTLSGCAVPASDTAQTQSTERVRVTFANEAHVDALVVRTPQDKALGLGGRESLGKQAGMLFVYDEPDVYSFWMKGMLIPIDIIWLHEGRIVDITSTIAPQKGPEEDLTLYSPKSEVSLVLEVNSGWASENSLSIGDTYDISEL